jgi:PhnB protein
MLWIQQWSMPISAACHENRTIFQRIRSLRESEKTIKLGSMSASTKYIQPGYSTVTPYLYAKPELADFLKNAFGAEITHPPTPDAAGQFHSEATIGGAHVLFGNGFFSDPSMAAAIYIYVPNVDATYKKAVSLGAKAIREPADMTWGDRVAGVKDTSGNTWWIATNTK